MHLRYFMSPYHVLRHSSSRKQKGTGSNDCKNELSISLDEIVEEVSTQDLKEVSTEDLRSELELRGYQTDNLWHIEDVMMKYDCESEVAQGVLIKALNNEATIEQVYLAIDIVADEVFNLKPKSNE